MENPSKVFIAYLQPSQKVITAICNVITYSGSPILKIEFVGGLLLLTSSIPLQMNNIITAKEWRKIWDIEDIDKNFKKPDTMNFGEATAALKEGKMLSRLEWNKGEVFFIFRQVPSNISKEIVPNMQSLPDLVKNEFARRFNEPCYQVNSIHYDDQIAMVNNANLITSWSPSISDIMATDWFIYE